MYIYLSVCLSVWLPACLPGRVGSRRVALRRVGSGRAGPGRVRSGRVESGRVGSGLVWSVCLSSAFSYTVMWLMIMVKITTYEINIVS